MNVSAAYTDGENRIDAISMNAKHTFIFMSNLLFNQLTFYQQTSIFVNRLCYNKLIKLSDSFDVHD